MLADRAAHGGDEPQFGGDGVEVAHRRQRERPASAAQFTRLARVSGTRQPGRLTPNYYREPCHGSPQRSAPSEAVP
jgi:hypothetical protein